MIYYEIQHHAGTERLKWLGAVLDDPGNTINFSLDTDSETFEQFAKWVARSGLNATVYCNRSLPVTWCGPSMLTVFRDALERALEIDGWEYFINLSGVCFPNKSQAEIKKILQYEKSVNNHTSFCYGFTPRREPVWFENSRREDALHYAEREYHRLKVSCTQRIINAFEQEAFDPLMNIMQRRGVCINEIAFKKQLIFRGLEAWEMQDRVAYWKTHDYVVGRAWFILHRKQIEWLVASPLLRSMYEQLSQTFCADETFVPSILFSDHNPYKNEVSSNNYRYRLGAPGYLGEDHLDEVFESGCLFARKLAKNISRESLKRIERQVAIVEVPKR